MPVVLIKNADRIITCDGQDNVFENHDILIEDGVITQIAAGIKAEADQVINAKGRFVYPGLVNTHHHMLQAFTRNIPEIQAYELFDWLKYLYNVWLRVTPETTYYSSMTAMGEFVKYGGTTMFDHHFAFPKGAGRNIIDMQFQAAEELGVRFHAGRSCFTRGKKQGGLPPDDLVETCQETLDDCQRLIEKYHNKNKFSMTQVAIAPCSPFSVDTEVMVESAKLARATGTRLHTHLAETLDEERYCLEVYGKRPLDWAEECDWLGEDCWYAHGIHFTDEEVKRLADTKTGVAHCPVSNMKLASGIAKVPLMLKLGVPVGLALDGSGSNDGSNMLADIRACFLLHHLNATGPSATEGSNNPPTAYEVLKLATTGSAELLGRDDIGSLAPGKAADLFMMKVDELDYVGGLLDPKAFIGTISCGNKADLTMINGKVVYKDGRLTGIDEEKIKAESADVFNMMIKA